MSPCEQKEGYFDEWEAALGFTLVCMVPLPEKTKVGTGEGLEWEMEKA